MRTNFYTFTKNKETKKLQLTTATMHLHSSLLEEGRKQFEVTFTKEYARIEYFKLQVKILNEKATDDDFEKSALLEEAFGFTPTMSKVTDFTGVIPELRGLLILSLCAHFGGLLEDITSDYDEETNRTKYKIKLQRFSWGLDKFYNKVKSAIIDFKNGTKTFEQIIDVVKPLYNEATTLPNHDAVDGICKKWEESTRAKQTKAFLMGLLPHYKLNRYSRIEERSPLYSLAQFEQYFLMWLVSEGELNSKTKVDKNTKTNASTFIKNIKNK